MKNNYFKVFLSMVLVFSAYSLSAQTKTQVQKIVSQNNQAALTQFQSEVTKRKAAQKAEAIRVAAQKGWKTSELLRDGRFVELQRIAKDGSPIYYTTYNVSAAASTRTNHINGGGSLGLNLDGQNMTAYIWDGGLARGTHQEYDGPGGNNRFSIGDNSTTLNFHAAHVTGTVIASGVDPAAKGMAPQASGIGHDWNSDVSEATGQAANGMLLSNHSYGFRSDLVPDYYFGAYIEDSRDWDNLQFNSPMYLMVVAAGNDGNSNFNGAPLNGNSAYDKLTGHSTSKNTMVVANAQDASVDASGNLISVTINSSSSEGPTDDLRIKPDITGNGTGVYSTYEGSDTEYASITGTSMASPNVMGSLLLLQQHYNELNGSFMRAASLKGLALHTADDIGPAGPDAVHGWGLLNAKRAAEAITANGNGSVIDQRSLNSGESYSVNVDSDGVNDLVVSISWTDRAGTVNTGTANVTTPVLVNDLDVRVTKNSDTFNPYRLTSITTNGTGDNNVDPYERVDISGAVGSYTVTVTHKGTLTGGSQDYTLIVTGASSTPIVCEATVPANVSAGNVTANGATINWNTVPGASYDVRYRVVGASSWTTITSNGSSTNLTGLTQLTDYEVQVQSKCDDGATSGYSASTAFSTPELILNYCASQGNRVNDEYIGRVQLGSIDNASGGGSGYEDFTAISTDLTKGDSYTISVTPTWTGTVYREGYGVWIDFNKNGTFDSAEQVFSQAATNASPVSGSFTVPAGAADGAVRMRVSMKYNGTPTACETFTYGQVEDYTVVLSDGSGPGPDTDAPTTPGNLAASNITQTTLDLSWVASSDNVGVTAYNVYNGTTSLGTVTGTTANITGLTADTQYTFNVSAVDAAGNESNLASVTVTTASTAGDTEAPTTPGNVTASNVAQTTLDLSWNASSDNVGVTGYNVYNGSTNIGTVTGTSANITGLTADTTYTFGVSAVDAAGNESSQGTVTVTTEAEAGDTEAPSVPTGLASSNITQTSVDLSWSASSDNFGVTGYDVLQDGSVIASPTGTSFSVSGLTADTTYSFAVRAKDAAGNISASSAALSVTTEAAPGGGDPVVIHEGFFESGWDGWIDGGTDAFRYSGSRSFEGNYSIRLRDNSGTRSSMTLNNVDVSSFDTVEVKFYFYAYSMENGEDFWVRFYDGSQWNTVATYARGTSFNNNTFYTATVTISAAEYNFAANSGFRFQCDASANGDQVYIDQVSITGLSNAVASTNSISAIQTFSTFSEADVDEGFDGDFLIYPNPVIGSSLNIRMPDSGEATYRIMDITGKQIKAGKLIQNTISVNELRAGMYLIELNDGEEKMTQKFMRR
ncbi:fibronectin type III domain-containing protein [Spongiivirga citrea]|uniref:S8 family serine peptidase n=1 Tax=Spongiivirga citrea TaxID=1481457 RepID=A0A6M0CM65_9FLAO|nr:fibronectin type III domain-containing protein [Spongiivirga citrea]NER19025.1 S8 family serine peptidase [Spongiivirga citrea]